MILLRRRLKGCSYKEKGALQPGNRPSKPGLQSLKAYCTTPDFLIHLHLLYHATAFPGAIRVQHIP